MRAKARVDIIAQVSGQLENAVHAQLLERGALHPISGSARDLQSELTAVLFQTNQSAIAKLDHAVADSNGRIIQLTSDWCAIRTDLDQIRVKMADVQATRRLAGKLASLLSMDNRWLWLSGLIATLVLVSLVIHERRHEIRRMLNGGRARSMGLTHILTAFVALMLVVTAAIFAGGDRISELFLEVSGGNAPHVRDDIRRELDASNGKLAELRTAVRSVDARFAAAISAVRSELQRTVGDDPKLAEQCEEAVRGSAALQIALRLEKELTEKLQQDVAQLEACQNELGANRSQVAQYETLKRGICAGLGLGLFSLVSSGGWLFRRGIRRKQEKIRSTCPLCLGTLKPEELESSDSPAGSMVRCTNQVTEQPFETCDFEYPATYQNVDKLCFPTLGTPDAGKTHWLAMVYRELNRGNFPEVVQFERIKSRSSEDLDKIVEALLHQKFGPSSTQTARIPHPIVFNFVDHDRLGVSEILLNIFDYSGEVLRSQTLEDRQRQRALSADGFLFFLNPTEPAETQAEALAGFREDLRRMKGLRAGEQIRSPVALCVPKIDLMINERYADPSGEGIIGNFYRDLGAVGWDLNLSSIEARSRIMARLRDTVWPGWQIERQVNDLFGGRYLFFPLSPVGLNGLGERDLSRRTIAPVGLLDPLLWLLHMNGYPVLNK